MNLSLRNFKNIDIFESSNSRFYNNCCKIDPMKLDQGIKIKIIVNFIIVGRTSVDKYCFIIWKKCYS